jgi:DNA-binding MarR family transcriptional regulator
LNFCTATVLLESTPDDFPVNAMKLTQTEYETLADLRHALRRFLHFSEECARAAGMTPQQHQALLAIKGHRNGGELTIGELAERLQIRHHSAVGLAARLVRKGYVTRKRDCVDRREVRLRLTAQGEKMLAALSVAHREQLRRVGPQIESLLKRLRG